MLKEGDKIYEIEYDSNRFAGTCKRKLLTHTVKKFENGIIYVKGTAWEIPFEDIGREYFLSKRAVLEQAVRNNLKEVENSIFDAESILETCKEVTAICRLLKKQEDGDSSQQ